MSLIWQKALSCRQLSLLAGMMLALALPAHALDRLDFQVKGGGEVEAALRDASLLLTAERDGVSNAQDLFAAAHAEYGRLLGTLYAKGHYSGVIEILLDGREAATIAPLDAPRTIRNIVLRVDPGPAFRFAKARIAPLAQGTKLPKGYSVGAPAESGVISEAAGAAVDGWRAVGHAKAEVTGQDITADHRRATLAANLTVSAGPRLRFGPLRVTGHERMNLRRLKKIAGLREGDQYDPEELEDAENRLRRTGVFRSVAMVEDESITSPDLLGITAKVVEEKTRRYSYGVEVASSEGAKISGYWLHRNLLGGAERLKVEGAVAQIGAQNSGADYMFGVTIERPATLTRDTTAALHFRIEREDEADYVQDSSTLGLSFTHYFSRELTARFGLEYAFFKVKDDSGEYIFRNLALPLGATWDKRNSKTDATQGFYIDGEFAPFLGLATTDSGAMIGLDARAYRGFGVDDKVTLAGRLQVKGVLGASIGGVPPEFLFYSGGGGSVRGQPYQSLGFPSASGGFQTGGTGFLGASVELRTKITETIGIVGFADFGQIANDGLFDGETKSHAGAGLGLRYATGFGPIRLDVAAPISGDTGKNVQIYVGIGQSF